MEMLLTILQDAMLSQGQDPAGVEVIQVAPDHPFLNAGSQQRIAVAARNAEGEEFIVIQFDPPEDIEPLIQHEAAHLIAWRVHGEGVKEHGAEFLRTCRATVTKRATYYCKRG